ncbi:hypothetical protein K1719_024051 [Acacia pycnantha]|nr:hypothetical protein K1719_024051 [Acacia pycnantha]
MRLDAARERISQMVKMLLDEDNFTINKKWRERCFITTNKTEKEKRNHKKIKAETLRKEKRRGSDLKSKHKASGISVGASTTKNLDIVGVATRTGKKGKAVL